MSGPSRFVVCARQVQWARAGPPTWRHGTGSCRASSSSAATTTIPASQAHVQTPPKAYRARSSRSKPNASTNTPSRRENLVNKDLVTSFRMALTAMDVKDTWVAWQNLCEVEQIGLVSTDEINELIKLIEGSKDSEDRLLGLSSHLIRAGKWTSLSVIIRAHTRAEQWDAVMDIAAKVLPIWKEVQTEARSATPTHSLIEDVVTFAAIACARREQPDVVPLVRLVRPLYPSFVHRVGSYHKTKEDAQQGNGSGLTVLGAIRILKSVFSDAASAQLAFTFCRHAILAWGLDYELPAPEKKPGRNGQSMGNMALRLNHLFKSDDVESVKLLLDTALEAKQADYGSWFTITSHSDSTADWSDRAWDPVLSRSIAMGKTEFAAQAWTAYTTIKPANETPTATIWNALLSGYAESKQWESVQATWQQMIAINRPTDPIDLHAYTTMMTALFESGKPSEALLIYEDLKLKVEKGQMQWNTVFFTAMMYGLCMNQRSAEATVILRDMIKGSNNYPKPSIGAINVLLKHYGNSGQLEKATDLLKTMSDLELAPDNYTFNTVMDAFVKSGRPGAVEDVMSAMHQSGVKLDSVTFSTLIRHHLLGENGDVVNFNAALKVLYKMEHEGPEPSIVTYAIIIKALFEHGDTFEVQCKPNSLRLVYEKVLRRYMVKQRDDSTEKGMPAMSRSVSFAFTLLKRSLERGLKPNRSTYHTLIAGLFTQAGVSTRHGDTALGLLYLRKAVDLSDECAAVLGPNSKTWILVLESLLEQATLNDSVVALQIREHLAHVIAQINEVGTEYHRTHVHIIRLMQQAAEISEVK